MAYSPPNIDPDEMEKFTRLSEIWWNPRGPMKSLHHIQPLRLNYIGTRAELQGKRVLDIGCGGGLLAESLAKKGALVTGLDINETMLNLAKSHARESGLSVDYRMGFAESLAEEERGGFDAVVCMEVLEHVPDPAGLIRACRNLVKPGGDVFFATINRTWMARFLAVWVAERVLGIVPAGTHDHRRFIKPEELTIWAMDSGLTKQDLSGVRYIPFGPVCYLTRDVSVNYMMHFLRH
jgi:2-polyprenyl-6-hydroxyphenyl methylase/3-demethylubiquinone-9 3-methyltransferase